MSTTEAPPEPAEPPAEPPEGSGAGPGPAADAAGDAAAAPAAPRPAPPAIDRLRVGDRRRLRRAWVAATVVVLVAYTWVLTAGTWDLFQTQFFDDFFDAQARSLFDGRLDVDPEVVGFEGFLVGGKTYMYFGPVPALLRMPVMAFTDALDGRLTTVSMLLAFVLLSGGTFRLACALRPFVRGDAPVGRREALATAGLAVAALAGPPFFLASAAVVYHEAALWGLALAVLAFDAVLRWAVRPTGRRLVGAVALITAAVLSRQSLGLAPLAALGLACLWYLWRNARAKVDDRPRRLDHRARALLAGVDRQAAFVLAVALVVPAAASVGLNYAKFGTLLTPPSTAHVHSLVSEDRQEFLADNGSLFGLQFAPTTLRQYVRPDGVDIREDFPYLDFPRFGPSAVGDTSFDNLDWSSSIPASAPALTALTAVAVVAAARAGRRRRRGARRARAAGEAPPASPAGPPWVRILCLGTVAGGFGVVAFGYIANRYLNDLYPAVLVPGIVGFHVLGGRAAGWRSARRPRLRRGLAMAAVGGLVVFGALVNTALALAYQRERGPVVPEPWRAEWVAWRIALPGSYAPYVVNEVYRRMPPDEAVFDGRLAVVGDCAGMYLHRNDGWVGVLRGPGVDVYDVVVDLDDVPADGHRVPLMTLGGGRAGDTTSIVALVREDDGRVRVDVAASPRRGGLWRRGEPTDLDGEVTLRIDADRREGLFGVTHGRDVLNGAPFDNDEARDKLGQAPSGRGVATRFPGRLRVDPVDMSACHDALDQVRYNRLGFPIVDD